MSLEWIERLLVLEKNFKDFAFFSVLLPWVMGVSDLSYDQILKKKWTRCRTDCVIFICSSPCEIFLGRRKNISVKYFVTQMCLARFFICHVCLIVQF